MTRRLLPLLLALVCAAGEADAPASEPKVVLVAGGDVLLDRGVKKVIGDRDAEHLFSGIAPFLHDADIALANLECPLTRSNAPVAKRFIFKADPELAATLAGSGFTALSLANNHSADFGRSGVIETMRHLEAAGIVAVGAGKDQDQAMRPRYFTVNGVTVAIIAFVDMAVEGLTPLSELPGPALFDRARLMASLREARAKADYVAVTAHWGIEYEYKPHYRQRALARLMAEAGADLIVGHHPHVLQSVEMIGDAYVFYSVGNLVFDQTGPARTESLLVKAELVKGGRAKVSVLPLRIENCRPAPAADEDGRGIIGRLTEISPGLEFKPGRDGWHEVLKAR